MFKINDLPFYWRLNNFFSPERNVVNDRYSFAISLNKENFFLQEKLDEDVKQALIKIYQQEHNIGYHQEVNTLARPYVDDLLNFLRTTIKSHPQEKLDILEIGCGGCLILEKLKIDGHNVMGVDPSPFAITEGQKRDVQVIQDFFPTERLKSTFDLIFHADVLEHTFDPVNFLKEQLNALNENAMLVVSVPDNTKNIELGDISFAMHQHVNYFDLFSLKRVMEAAGLTDVKVCKSGYGGSLYGLGIKRRDLRDKFSVDTFDKGKYSEFFVAAHKNVASFCSWFKQNQDRKIAFYCPLRILPYLAFVNLDERHQVRFIDDTPHWHHCFFDGQKIIVENREDFLASPGDVVFIASLTFASVIEKKLRDVGYTGEVVKLEEFLGDVRND